MPLPVGDTALMASDTTGDREPAPAGHNVSLSIDPGDLGDARRIFAALFDDGVVILAFGRQFWGGWFGSCTDRFGISWMVTASDTD